MAIRPKIFIASSSEGLEVTHAVRRLLLQELGDRAEIEPWPRKFDLSATYIESLEKSADHADFAISVLTADDLTTSRKKESLAPRDNVVFELGLFMGRLGRERCYLIRQNNSKLKLPSDLLGVHLADFTPPADGNLKAVLDPVCALIAERIGALGIRQKLTSDNLAARAGLKVFCQRITGKWWERISGGTLGISLLEIDFDDASHAIRLGGRSYDREGNHLAFWNSVLAGVLPDEKKVVYHWKGWFVATPNKPFHGFGEMEFEGPGQSNEPLSRGRGKFWNIDETKPELSAVRTIELRRLNDEKQGAIMSHATEKEIRTLVSRMLRDW